MAGEAVANRMNQRIPRGLGCESMVRLNSLALGVLGRAPASQGGATGLFAECLK